MPIVSSSYSESSFRKKDESWYIHEGYIHALSGPVMSALCDWRHVVRLLQRVQALQQVRPVQRVQPLQRVQALQQVRPLQRVQAMQRVMKSEKLELSKKQIKQIRFYSGRICLARQPLDRSTKTHLTNSYWSDRWTSPVCFLLSLMWNSLWPWGTTWSRCKCGILLLDPLSRAESVDNGCDRCKDWTTNNHFVEFQHVALIMNYMKLEVCAFIFKYNAAKTVLIRS